MAEVASSREDAWIETKIIADDLHQWVVASSREDAWIETDGTVGENGHCESRPPARTRGLKPATANHEQLVQVASSREDAWIETRLKKYYLGLRPVASSREDAWIETQFANRSSPDSWSRPPARTRGLKLLFHLRKQAEEEVASSREDAWIETVKNSQKEKRTCRVLPRGRVD